MNTSREVASRLTKRLAKAGLFFDGVVEDGVALCAVILLATSIMSPMSVKGLRVSGTSVPLTGRRTNDTSLLFLFSMRYPHQVGGGNGGYHGKLFYL